MQTLHFAWQLFQALALTQVNTVLAAAVQIMQTYLDNQLDPAVYLGQVHQRPLWAAWQEIQNITK